MTKVALPLSPPISFWDKHAKIKKGTKIACALIAIAAVGLSIALFCPAAIAAIPLAALQTSLLASKTTLLISKITLIAASVLAVGCSLALSKKSENPLLRLDKLLIPNDLEEEEERKKTLYSTINNFIMKNKVITPENKETQLESFFNSIENNYNKSIILYLLAFKNTIVDHIYNACPPKKITLSSLRSDEIHRNIKCTIKSLNNNKNPNLIQCEYDALINYKEYDVEVKIILKIDAKTGNIKYEITQIEEYECQNTDSLPKKLLDQESPPPHVFTNTLPSYATLSPLPPSVSSMSMAKKYTGLGLDGKSLKEKALLIATFLSPNAFLKKN